VSVKTVIHPVTGKSYKLGRRRPVARGPRLRLRNYLYKDLPPPPPLVDYSSKARAALAQVYLNDQLGDCVIAGIEHVAGVLTGNVGAPVIFDDANTKRLYGAIGGYVDGDESTDNGCDEVTALNYWQENGLLADGEHKISGWIAVDGTNADEIKTALWLFENLIFGVPMPDAWVNPMPSGSGFIWDVGGDSDDNNGHCFVGVGYNEKTVTIGTWGMLGDITVPAIARYASGSGGGELYAALSSDAVAKAAEKAPNGFDFSQLLADLDSLK
jgi:hypothetical protein